MVRISRQRLDASRRPVLRNNNNNKASSSTEAMYGAAVVLGMVTLFGLSFGWISSREGKGTTAIMDTNRVLASPGGGGGGEEGGRGVRRHQHPQLHVPGKNSDQYDALATDILQTLDCKTLLNVTHNNNNHNKEPDFWRGGGYDDDFGNFHGNTNNNNNNQQQQQQQRRLEEQEQSGRMPQDDDGTTFTRNQNNNDPLQDQPQHDQVPGFDDFVGGNDDDELAHVLASPNAQHLFCLAAAEDVTDVAYTTWQDTIHCQASRYRKALLDLWNMARSEIPDTDLLKRVLAMSYEGLYTIADAQVYLWDPAADTGLQYMVAHVNSKEKTVDDGGLYGLDHNLGPGRIFVDVGSGLGTTSMAMSLLYPGTRIISIEVASPNWLLQEINWRCNADVLTNPPSSIVLAGVGPAASQASFAKYLWKPDLTTATRSWTPASERTAADIEIAVHLQSWHALTALAEFQHVDVLNVDCGACEYNFIPALSDEEFDAIHTVMGGMHWGYIPRSKLPSSQRGRETHARLCQHENFAKTAKECCDVPQLRVKSSYPGQVLVHDAPGVPKEGTVADVAGDLCNNFDQWAAEKHLHDVENDYGWFHLSSVAEGY